ncbi:MAG TPA: hypothetical protein VJU86_05090 [Pyrinomonadaceae bacterium]|nr:hypothetical protein [Pyrinomonadaceae bacterium]
MTFEILDRNIKTAEKNLSHILTTQGFFGTARVPARERATIGSLASGFSYRASLQDC